LGESIYATLGGFWFEQDSTYDSFQDIRYIPVFPLQFTQPDNIKADAQAVFAHLSVEPIENLTLSGGLRYTEESKDYQYFRFLPNGQVNPFQDLVGAIYGVGYSGPDTLGIFGSTTAIVTALSGTVNSYSASRWDWRLSADYRISPEVLVYANVATGFKGGGTNPRPFTAAQALISFDPETLTAYEAGFKTDLFDRMLRLNVSAFYNDFKGLQVPVLACPDAPCAARLNAADAHVKGFEVEGALNLHNGLLIDASLSYLDFAYSRIVDPLAGFPANPAGIAVGDPGGSPEWKWSLGVQYEINLGDAGSLTPRLDAYYQADQFTGAAVVGTTRTFSFIPNYTIANARLTYRSADEDWSVALEVTNLFDKYYYNSVFDLSGIGLSRRANPAAPREWALTVRRSF
jgi:iron complex outermembrane receptor protein